MDEQIVAKLDEILDFLKSRKPEVDEKLEHVKSACSVPTDKDCSCEKCKEGTCECSCCK